MPDLVGGLVGARAAQLVRAVGGEQDQRQAAVVRLEDGGVQVGDGGARRGDDRDRPRCLRLLAGAVRGGARETDREERGRPLVDPHVQAQAGAPVGPLVVGTGGVRERVRQRRAAGAGGEHDVLDAQGGEGLDEHPGCRRRRVGIEGRRRHARHHARASTGSEPGDPPGGELRRARSRRRAGPGRDRAGGRRARRRPAGTGGPTRSAVEQLRGGEAARVGQLGERGRERDPGREPDGRLEGRRDDDGQPDPLRELQARAHAAEGLDLEHDDVRGVRAGDRERVLGAADRLVGGDRHVRAAAQRREVVDAGHRLLRVLEPAGGPVERDAAGRPPSSTSQAALASTRIAPAGPERVADRLQAGDLVGDATGPARRP